MEAHQLSILLIWSVWSSFTQQPRRGSECKALLPYTSFNNRKWMYKEIEICKHKHAPHCHWASFCFGLSNEVRLGNVYTMAQTQLDRTEVIGKLSITGQSNALYMKTHVEKQVGLLSECKRAGLLTGCDKRDAEICTLAIIYWKVDIFTADVLNMGDKKCQQQCRMKRKKNGSKIKRTTKRLEASQPRNIVPSLDSAIFWALPFLEVCTWKGILASANLYCQPKIEVSLAFEACSINRYRRRYSGRPVLSGPLLNLTARSF